MPTDNEKNKEIKQIITIILLILFAMAYSFTISYYFKMKKGYRIIGTSTIKSISISPNKEYYLGIYINHSDVTDSDWLAVYLLNNYAKRYCIYCGPMEKEPVLEWIDHDTVSINDKIIELSEYEMIFIE